MYCNLLRVLRIWTALLSFLLMVSGCVNNDPFTLHSSSKGEAKSSVQDKSSKDEPHKVKIMIPTENQDADWILKEYLKRLTELHPGIEVEVQSTPIEQYANALELSFASGNPPDVFRVTAKGISLRNAYERGWLQPLDPYLTDTFTKQYKEGTFSSEGNLAIGGNVYAIPVEDGAPNRIRLLYYNADLLKKHGFDGPPQTWSELKEMSSSITMQGNGNVYGFSIIGKNFSLIVEAFRRSSGSYYLNAETTPPLNMMTGKAGASDPTIVASVEFIKDLYHSNIMTPGWENWSGPAAFKQMVEGKLAMYVGANWHLKEIRKLNPNFNLGIAPVPTPDKETEARTFYEHIPFFGMSSQVVHPDAAWKVIEALGSSEYQRTLLEKGTLVANRDAYEGITLNGDTLRILEISSDQEVRAPSYNQNHPDGEKLITAIIAHSPEPPIDELYLMGVLGNKDYLKLAAEYDQQLDNVIIAQVDKLRREGSTITKEDLSFPQLSP